MIKLTTTNGTVHYFSRVLAVWGRDDGCTAVITEDCDLTSAELYHIKETTEEILALIEAEKAKALRDEFAKAVLPKVYVEFAQGSAIAKACYQMADAMLRAREV